VPRRLSPCGGCASVAIVTATVGRTAGSRRRRAGRATCGAAMNVGMTSSLPVR
jgi:hypothetical protein